MPPVVAPLAEAARAIGLPVQADMNGPEREGFSTFQQTRRGRRRISAARAYLHPAMDRPNLTIIDQALVLRIVLEGGRAAGIVLRRDGAERVVRARREVVLSAGAIGSPHLLMLSGIGPGEQLAALGIPVLRDMPGIGANLQDHYITRMSFRLADAPLVGQPPHRRLAAAAGGAALGRAATAC